MIRTERPDKYRLDGSPYLPGLEGLLEWGRDLEDTRGRIVRQELLWNGLWLSTVWLGLDHNYTPQGPPLIFETMAFDRLGGGEERGLLVQAMVHAPTSRARPRIGEAARRESRLHVATVVGRNLEGGL